MILPSNNNNYNKENIHNNEQVLVTPLDIYSTFLDIIQININTILGIISEIPIKKIFCLL